MSDQTAGECYLHKIPPTPLVPVQLDPDLPPIWCKLEFLNPSGSTKDRIARHILEKARRRGIIRTGSTVVEASSGSTSIALALACAQMRFKFVAFIPDSATSERSLMIQAYGGEVRRISGVGTGGTLQGLFEAFDSAGCAVKPVAAVPAENEVFGENIECCSFKFSSDVPGVVNGVSKLFHDWSESGTATGLEKVEVGDCHCLELTRRLWRLGFPVGPSSGLNLGAAMEVAKNAPSNTKIVTVFPDRMERYFSHKVFETIKDCE